VRFSAGVGFLARYGMVVATLDAGGGIRRGEGRSFRVESSWTADASPTAFVFSPACPRTTKLADSIAVEQIFDCGFDSVTRRTIKKPQLRRLTVPTTNVLVAGQFPQPASRVKLIRVDVEIPISAPTETSRRR